jgi:hypothetical protein
MAPEGLVASTVIGAGTVIDGAVVSPPRWTMTENVVCDGFCELSLALHVTVVFPTPNKRPDGGVHVIWELGPLT